MPASCEKIFKALDLNLTGLRFLPVFLAEIFHVRAKSEKAYMFFINI